MKQMKSTIIALVLCVLCAGASAQTVTVADVEAIPGETVSFKLNLAGGKANTYIALQFDAQFPATGFTLTGDYSISSQWENSIAVIGSVNANGLATIPVSSSEAISATDVDGLLTVNFTVGSDVALGYYNVNLTNLWFGYGTSSKDKLSDVTFAIHVVAEHNAVIKGDVNGNGEVDIDDAVCILRHLVNKPNDHFVEAAADVNGNNEIDIDDAVMILKYLVGKINALSRDSGSHKKVDWDLYDPD